LGTTKIEDADDQKMWGDVVKAAKVLHSL